MSGNVLNAFMDGRQLRQGEEDRRQRNALMMDDRRAQQANTNVSALMMGGQQQDAPRYEGQAETNLSGMDKARGAAIQSGNPDVMANFQQQVAAMSAADRDAAARRLRGRRAAAMTLLGIPEAERAQWVRANPQTVQSAGLTVEQVLSQDLSDQNLRADVRMAQSMDDELFADITGPQTLGENDTRVDMLTGRQTIGQAGQDARGLEGRGLDIRQHQADTARMQAQRPAAPLVNVNTGEQQLDPFQSRMAEQEASNFASFLEQAPTAQRNLARVDRLSQLLSEVNTGPGASMQAAMGRIGIPTEGLSEIQAAEALISAMIPDQRPPGSGVMSDADLELFRRSLPSLMNTPDGNQLIVETIRGVNEYDVRLGQIAQAAAAGQVSREDARRMVSQLQNPIDAVRQREGGNERAQAVQIMTGDDYAQLPAGTRYIDPNGIERVKQ